MHSYEPLISVARIASCAFNAESPLLTLTVLTIRQLPFRLVCFNLMQRMHVLRARFVHAYAFRVTVPAGKLRSAVKKNNHARLPFLLLNVPLPRFSWTLLAKEVLRPIVTYSFRLKLAISLTTSFRQTRIVTHLFYSKERDASFYFTLRWCVAINNSRCFSFARDNWPRSMSCL